MVYTTSNDDLAVHLPWTPSSSTFPTTASISSMRTQSARIINTFLGQTGDVVDTSFACYDIEVDLTLIMIENAWKRAKGDFDQIVPVKLTEDQMELLRRLYSSSEMASGQYSVDVP